MSYGPQGAEHRFVFRLDSASDPDAHLRRESETKVERRAAEWLY